MKVKEISYSHHRVPRLSATENLKKGKPPERYVISYLRKCKRWGFYMPLGQRGDDFESGMIELIALPRGGMSICLIYLGSGITIIGKSICSMSDNFCYKTGREIAYGRAMKKLKEMEVNGNGK